MNRVNVDRLRKIAEVEFSNLVAEAFVQGTNALRIILMDGSFVDIWFSLKLSSRYSYHWERHAIDGTIFRYDNAPHKRWQAVSTFPKHFHDASEDNVVKSHISEVPEEALREFFVFVRNQKKS